MMDKRRYWSTLSCVVLLLSALACARAAPSAEPTVPSALPSPTSAPATPSGQEDLEAALAAEVVDDRPEVLAYLGRPDAFTISIVELEGATVRMESWRYYQFGTRVDFCDGEAVWTQRSTPCPTGRSSPPGMTPSPLRPG